MDMTLYRAVGSLKRVALGDLATSEFYAASVDDRTGIITLQPVNIVDGAARRAPAADVQEESVADPEGTNPGDASADPWSDDFPA
jgi:hypothetical protein